MSVAIIGCRGGSRKAPELLQQCGWLYGTRHNYKPYAQPYMLDIDWEKYTWSDYVTKVRAWKPTLAMVPDYFASTSKSKLLEQIEEIREAGAILVMVCPKFTGAVDNIAYTEAFNGVLKLTQRTGRGYSFRVIRGRMLYRLQDSTPSVIWELP